MALAYERPARGLKSILFENFRAQNSKASATTGYAHATGYDWSGGVCGVVNDEAFRFWKDSSLGKVTWRWELVRAEKCAVIRGQVKFIYSTILLSVCFSF
jgi:hypothetical protein